LGTGIERPSETTMPGPLRKYIRWLHTQWPAGTVEKLPAVREDGSTNVPGLYVVGDLTGIPLLKFSADTGARAVRTIIADPSFGKRDERDAEVFDVAIIGGGVSGFAAALEARKAGLRFVLYEAAEPFSTVANFPKAKPIYTYPTDMTPAGDLQFHEQASVKEGLLEDLRAQTLEAGIEPTLQRVDGVSRRGRIFEMDLPEAENAKAHRVIIAIGRSGNFRALGAPGEDLGKVSNRLHDPADFRDRNVLVVGGGDSAMETAIALATCGSNVILSYRKDVFSRPKPENIEKIEALVADPGADATVERPSSGRVSTAVGDYMGDERRPGSLRLMMGSSVEAIDEETVSVRASSGETETFSNDAVFSMIGREAPLDFFRRSGVHIRGEWRASTWIGFLVFFAFCTFIYHWKTDAGLPIKKWFEGNDWFPFNVADPSNPANLLGTLVLSMQKPSFYYTLAYTVCIVLFGIQRIRRRRTPYITRQTATLMAVQVIPLFLLPFIVLPWMGHNGLFDSGVLGTIADHLFPETQWDGHGREYWRSVGFILAWPLMFWNVFTNEPLAVWLVISLLQTFVIIPFIVWRWGKGAYCGWICSCGALAETMGDAHRHKMPHGPRWNRVNLIGQVFLVLALVLLVVRLIGWIAPDGSGAERVADTIYMAGLHGKGLDWQYLPFGLKFLNYAWFVDLLWAGIFGVAFYFWFSGRVWCRFACPLAALMHIYARFSQFRIISEKKKCISCNVCTSVCHQGIDIMSFANKGLPMEDPECVRCSACVQSCPTGVLQFGRVNRQGDVIAYDRVGASPVRMAEVTVHGRSIS
jgi:thioredoxin reductase/ferredoxin